ncbi:MAG: transposase [Clostridia bacterium]|nr:transposase [Clostridia bacterium]
MSRQARQISDTGYYHVIVRGIGRQLLFEDASDYRYYLLLLERYSKETALTICAYCLMENHVHLLVRDVGGGLPLFMKKMGISYAAFFNKKYDRTGHLFQDRYRSESVTDDAYFLTVNRYILKNPQEAGICRYSDYPWSSYKLYGDNSSFVDTSLLSSMLEGNESYDEFLSKESGDVCLDHYPAKLSDERAKEIIKKKLGVESGVVLQKYDRRSRDEAIICLNNAGLSERQIERLTGISRRIVHEILW